MGYYRFWDARYELYGKCGGIMSASEIRFAYSAAQSKLLHSHPTIRNKFPAALVMGKVKMRKKKPKAQVTS